MNSILTTWQHLPLIENERRALELLQNRKKGGLFFVKGDRMQIATSIFDKMRICLQSKQQQKVGAYIGKALSHVLIESKRLSHDEQEVQAISALFKEKIGRLSMPIRSHIFAQLSRQDRSLFIGPEIHTDPNAAQSSDITAVLPACYRQDLHTLLTLRENDPLTLGDQGCIRRVKGFFSHFQYFFTRAREKQRVKARVEEIVAACGRHAVEKNQKAIRHLFFDKLSLLTPRSLFDPAWIFKSGALEQLLQPRMVFLRQEIQNHRNMASPLFDSQKATILSDLQLELSSEEADLAIRLGIQPARFTSSSSGTYFIYNRHRQVIGIFKPADEGPRGKNNPHIIGRLKRLIWFLKERTGLISGQESISEELAYLVSQRLKLHIVPPTKVKTFSSSVFYRHTTKTGSFQLFIRGCADSYKFLGIPHFIEKLPIAFWKMYFACKFYGKKSLGEKIKEGFPKNLLEMVAILDFLTGNIDRHLENLLFKRVGQNSLLKSLFRTSNDTLAICIDNGSSFPSAHARGYLSTRFMHEVGDLPQAEQPFSENTRQLIAPLYQINVQTQKTGWHELLKEITTKWLQAIPEMAKADPAYQNKLCCDILKLPHDRVAIKDLSYQTALTLYPERKRFKECKRDIKRTVSQLKVLQENIEVLQQFLFDDSSTIRNLCHVKKQSHFDRMLYQRPPHAPPYP